MYKYNLFVFFEYELSYHIDEIDGKLLLIEEILFVTTIIHNLVHIYKMETDKEIDFVEQKIKEVLDNDAVSFYLIYPQDSIRVVSESAQRVGLFPIEKINNNKSTTLNVDEILDKVNISGIESLSEVEKMFLSRI